MPCIEVNEDTQINCDEKCKEIKNKKTIAKEQEEREKRQALEKAQQEELEKYERKKHGRKRKQKQQLTEDIQKDGLFGKYKYFIGISLLGAIFIAFSVHLMIQS